MKKWLLLALLAVLPMLSACAGAQSEAAQKAAVENGALVVSLAGNPTTGYEWSCTDEALRFVRCEAVEYTPDATDGLLEGGGGVFRFRFVPVGAGTETLHFAYARSWLADSTTEEYALTVTVTETADGFAMTWK